MVGVIVKLAFGLVDVPTKVVKVALEYHFQVAPVPRVPPDWVSVVGVLLPEQILVTVALIVVPAMDCVMTVTVTLFVLSLTGPQADPDSALT